MSRVFFVASSERFDTSTADQFGDKIDLLVSEREISPFATEKLLGTLSDRLEEQSFDPAVDYVAVTGPAALVALFLAVIAWKYPKARTLMFNAKEQKYLARSLDMTRI